MLTPKRGLVRPRVVAAEGGEPLLLEDHVRWFAEGGARGHVAVLGPPGSGKTTALQHLAAVLPTGADVAFRDNVVEYLPWPVSSGLLIYSTEEPQIGPLLATCRLLPWTRDDLIEYLLAAHKDHCRSVMSRILPSDFSLLQGVPDLWQIVLEELARDDALPNARSALNRYLRNQLQDTDVVERARSACLNALAGRDGERPERPGFAPELVRVLRHPAAQLLLAAERLAADLESDADCDWLARRLPRDLVRSAAVLISDNVRVLNRLRTFMDGPEWGHATAASLLHAADPGWVPSGERTIRLAGAYLDRAAWPGVRLARVRLDAADLGQADLSGADLTNGHAQSANLSRARLCEARLDGLDATGADLTGTDLTAARAERVCFQGANLRGACLESAALTDSVFADADVREAVFRGARLTGANFKGAKVRGADFASANLTGACLQDLRLREAVLDGACFEEADLRGCDLEYVELPGANFVGAKLTGAVLTGSRMPNAEFRRAFLMHTGLADVDWEGADLRGADLSGATFQAGTCRSGLVGSPIACEGSRTGFYTDDYEDRSFKPPEEIRKANLCGADLRGANLTDVDFYLVDLRGALYNPKWELHFRNCGAILGARV